MMIFYYGLPTVGVQGITPFTAVVAGLVLYNGSVLAEVFRAGIESLPRGQSEAGYAIGLPKSKVMPASCCRRPSGPCCRSSSPSWW